MKESIAKIGYCISQAFGVPKHTFEIGHVLIIAVVFAAINFLLSEVGFLVRMHEWEKEGKNEEQHQD